MPNRILKESVCTSPNIEGLGWFEEVCFYRLIVQCDDFGRMDARPLLLRSKLFPIREDVTVAEVEAAVGRLEEAELLSRYTVEGREYLQLLSWDRHQKIRTKRAKWPAQEGSAGLGSWDE